MTSSSLPTLVNKPNMVEYENFRFLIHDAPTDSTLSAYISIYLKKHVTCCVRACEATYAIQPLLANNIKVYEMPYSDGEAPPSHMVTSWLQLCKQEFIDPQKAKSNPKQNANHAENKELDGKSVSNSNSKSDKSLKRTIAVHCVAGLGRAPVLVCIALIEFCGFSPLDAVDYVRKRRRGAINARQLKFIEAYKPRKNKNKDKCIIT